MLARVNAARVYEAVADVCSLPGVRRPALIGMHESTLIDLLNGALVLFNPPPCMACGLQSQEVLGPCGHPCFCSVCFRDALQLRACSWCEVL